MSTHTKNRNVVPAHVRIETLALMHELTNEEGGVNYNAFGKKSGIAPSTVLRICKKQDPTYTFNPTTLQSLVSTFDISMNEAMGLIVIDPDRQPLPPRAGPIVVEAESNEFILLEAFSKLNKAERSKALQYVEERVKLQQIEACSHCGGPMEHLGKREIIDEFGIKVNVECYSCPACAESDRAMSIVERLKSYDR